MMHRCETIGNNENYVNYIKHSINKSRNQWNFARVLIQVVRDLRPCEIWRSSRFSRGPLDFLCSIRKKKYATKDNRKVLWSSRRLSSLFPLGSTFPASAHPPSFFLLSHDESQGRQSIDWFPSAIDPTRRLRSRRTPAELVNGSSQFSSCEIYPSQNHLLFANHSLQSPFLPSLLLPPFPRLSLYLSFCCCSRVILL